MFLMRGSLYHKISGIVFVLFILLHCPSQSTREYRALIENHARMRLVPSGSFMMGSTAADAPPNERPAHAVYLDAFYMSETPVTYRQYREFVNAGAPLPAQWHYPSYNQPEQPVTGISWHEAACYCNWRSLQEGRAPAYSVGDELDVWGYRILNLDSDADGYRLPTEAQFERAARGGLAAHPYPWGADFRNEYANYDQAQGFHEHEGLWWRLADVHSQKANAFGLRGMSGNVHEWMQDWYADNYAHIDPDSNPHGPDSGRVKVLRGGSWGSPSPEFLRVSRRSFAAPGFYNYDIGFRMVLPAEYAQTDSYNNAVAIDAELMESRVLRLCNMGRRNESPPRTMALDSDAFRRRLTAYIRDHFSESIYFHQQIDGQPILTPESMADLILESTRIHNIHPLYLVGIMRSESGFGTVSFPRWFNNPMAYHWANWKMANGAPLYAPVVGRNRRYRNLREGFLIFSAGLRREIYIRAARQDFYRFHIVYVGSEALEWMNGIDRVYRDVLGIPFSRHEPSGDCGARIYRDWDELKHRYP
ncbi:MAG: formylglycine-generating enzyme family protein, partial [Leptospiraceae bacterium]|nr:formylglycine-generating enzyme family protein [Leptospiraceae bacterium]